MSATVRTEEFAYLTTASVNVQTVSPAIDAKSELARLCDMVRTVAWCAPANWTTLCHVIRGPESASANVVTWA